MESKKIQVQEIQDTERHSMLRKVRDFYLALQEANAEVEKYELELEAALDAKSAAARRWERIRVDAQQAGFEIWE